MLRLQEEEARLAEPVYVSHAVPESMHKFVDYLKTTKYTLFVIVRHASQIAEVKAEYASWTSTPQNPKGEALPANALRDYSDVEPTYPRCWCLDFAYSPDIDYPFAVLARGTGNQKTSRNPVTWLNNNHIESRYAATAELVVHGGLRAFKP